MDKIEAELKAFNNANRQLLNIRRDLNANLSDGARKLRYGRLAIIVGLLFVGLALGFALGLVYSPQIYHIVTCHGQYNYISNTVVLHCGAN